MDEFSEKRKYRRIEKPYIARFRIRTDEAQDLDSKNWDMVAVNDLGAGSLFFHLRGALEIGTVLDLKLSLSTSIPPVECRGVVTRVKKHPVFPVFGTATAFTEIDKDIKEMINKLPL